MTGDEIGFLRQALGLDPAHFAQLLGVHTSTVYRWEAAGAEPVRVEPFQLQLLTVMRSHLQGQAPPARKELGQLLLEGLLVGGAIFGLFKLLEAAFAKPEPQTARNGGAGDRGAVPRKRSSPTSKRR